MANNITMLDVFRSMHSMNVEHVRQLFVHNHQLIICKKDEIIHNLETQLYDINSACGINCANCVKLKQDMDTQTNVYRKDVHSLRMRANNDEKRIHELNMKIDKFKELKEWNQMKNWRDHYDTVVALNNSLEIVNKNLKTENAKLRANDQQNRIPSVIIGNSGNNNEDSIGNCEHIELNDANKVMINSVEVINSDDNPNKEIPIRSETNSQTEKAVNNSYQPFFNNLLLRLKEKDTYNVFAEPVNTNEVTDYLQIIKNPMDFSTIRKNIMNNKYLTYDAFEADFELIIKNCIYYNDKETVYYKSAIKLREKTTEILKEWRINFELCKRNPGLNNPQNFDDINNGQQLASVTQKQTLPSKRKLSCKGKLKESDGNTTNKISSKPKRKRIKQ